MLVKGERKLVPENIQNLNPYVAGKTIAEVIEAYHPPQISKLASNENRLGCSPLVKDAIMEAFEQIQDYPDSASRKLRAKIAERFAVKPENVIVGAGSESIISMITKTFFLDHEEAITADVTFVGFLIQAGIRGIKIDRLPLTKDFRFDVHAMIEAINDHTKMIYIANPNNPTGTYITKDEFDWFIKRVPDDVLVIMDEAYYEFASDQPDFPDTLKYRLDKVLTLRTFSKAYGLAGFRVGYGIGSEHLIKNLFKVKLTFEPTTLAQAAAIAALDDDAFIEKTKAMVSKNKNRLYNFLKDIGISYVPSYANSVLIYFPTEQEAIGFAQQMLEMGVIIRRMNGFGMPNGVRITIGTDEEMDHLEQSIMNIVPS